MGNQIRIPMDSVEKREKVDPGFIQELRVRGTVEGEYLLLDENDYLEVKRRSAELKLSAMGMSLMNSSVSWAKSGFKVSESPEVERRLEICRACEHWDSEAFNRTGRCLKCGCSTWAKIRLATEKCPIGKW